MFKGEIWLWVPSGVKQAEIYNPRTGEKYTYPFGKPLVKTELYFMVLNVDNLTLPTKNKKVEVKWFTIYTTPLGAEIMIDSVPAGVTPFTGSLAMGSHNLIMDYEGEVKKQEIIVNQDFLPVVYMNFTGEGKPPKPVDGFIDYEEQPEFPGGITSMMKFLRDKLNYPRLALENGISGTVFLQFKVDETGKISNIKILRGIGGGCDEEAIRVVKLMPTWKPGIQSGRRAICYFNLPVKFNTMIVNSVNGIR